MRWWDSLFGASTRGRIVALLRRGNHTVDEIAGAVGLTDNGVRSHLATLERDGVVAVAGERRGSGAGKPATLYGLATQTSTLFSSAYAPALAALVAELTSVHPEEVEALLRGAGRRLARPASGTFPERVQAAARMLASLGAEADVERTGDGFVVTGYGCAIGDTVASNPAACCMMEQLLTDITGADVREQCDRSANPPRCGFRITK